MLGDTVKGWRRERGWKQNDVVRLSKGRLTQTYLSKLEGNGITQPTRSMMEALADVFERPIAELYRAAGVLEGVGDSPPPPPAGPVQLRDSDRLTVAEMVADIESRKGAWFQRELAEARATMSRA